MAVIATELFAGTDGSPWPSDTWAVGVSGGTATIQDGWGRLTRNAGRVSRRFLATAPSDQEMSGAFRMSSDNWCRFCLRGNDALDSSRGYWFEPALGGTAVTFGRDGSQTTTYTGGASFSSVTVPFTITAGTSYSFRWQAVTEGSSVRLRFKLWPSSSSEPATWTAERVDSSGAILTASVAVGVSLDAPVSGTYIEVDNLTVSTSLPPEQAEGTFHTSAMSRMRG